MTLPMPSRGFLLHRTPPLYLPDATAAASRRSKMRRQLVSKRVRDALVVMQRDGLSAYTIDGVEWEEGEAVKLRIEIMR